MTSGYIETTLPKKLGIRPGHTVVLLNVPPTVLTELGTHLTQARLVTSMTDDPDIIHLFVDRKTDLEKQFPLLKKLLPHHAAIWISWPKRGSNMQTDLTEDIIREIGLACGLVDVKVCSVDDTWSGLKFVYRLKDR